MYKQITDFSFELASENLDISTSIVPWDTNAFGYPVAQINSLEIRDNAHAMMAFELFREWFNCVQVRVISCRLPHIKMRESMFLESNGFRFVEMVLHPYCEQLETLSWSNGGVEITPQKNRIFLRCSRLQKPHSVVSATMLTHGSTPNLGTGDMDNGLLTVLTTRARDYLKPWITRNLLAFSSLKLAFPPMPISI